MKRSQVVALLLLSKLSVIPNVAFASEDAFIEPFQKKEELKKDYDSVKNESCISSSDIQWQTSTVTKTKEGDSDSSMALEWSYISSGKTPKSPKEVSFAFYGSTHGGLPVEFKEVFLRFGNQKAALPVDFDSQSYQGFVLTSFKGKMPVNLFLAMCKAKKVYFKLGYQPRVLLVTEPYMTVPQELAATIPLPPTKTPAKKPKK